MTIADIKYIAGPRLSRIRERLKKRNVFVTLCFRLCFDLKAKGFHSDTFGHQTALISHFPWVSTQSFLINTWRLRKQNQP